MNNPDAPMWEALAREGGSFPVLTHDGALAATAEFFATGEADMAALLAQVTALIGTDVPLTSALDYGCGAGRLTLPLARRATRVTACDIAPTMLVHARVNAEKAGLHNITYIRSEQLTTLPEHQFTFICSLLVFQYVPRRIGYETIRALLRLLAPNGIALLHVMLAPRRIRLRQLAAMSRRHTARSAPQSDGLQIYEYDERVLLRDIEAANAQILGRVIANAGATRGAVLIVRGATAPPPP
ncbi:MAG TPA: class I SAM-dependent methyltransferase [Thermoanaerobaculia bacterium]